MFQAKCVTWPITELQLRPKVMHVTIDRETKAQRAAQQWRVLALVADPHVIAHDPLAIRVHEMLEERRLRRVAHQLRESSFPLVVILSIEIHHPLPFHVRLAGKDEDFHWLGRCDGVERGAEEAKSGEDKSRMFHRLH